MNRLVWKISWRVLLLVIVTMLGAFLWVRGWYTYAFFTLPVLLWLAYGLYRFQKKVHDEVAHFLESIKYRDFSRYFDVHKVPTEIAALRKGFNDINVTFKAITREKEVQYQYLQKMLELVDTGILSYKELDGEIVWMNESVKKMLRLPYMRTIHSLEKRNPVFYAELIALQPGKTKVIAIQEFNRVLVSCTTFQTDGIVFKVLALQNVNEALDVNELQSWQKLLRVLTHEIMNSVAPISSLADTLKKRIENRTDQELLPDLEQGIDTIKSRSDGLIRFAETYRNLNKITSIHKRPVLVRDLFEGIYTLMEPTLEQKNIALEIVLKNANLQVNVDASLLEQVLINLITNAIEAVKLQAHPVITLTGIKEENNTFIKISDNGAGIPEDLLDEIFVPFFSTKKKGSGIGLSICKQIVLLHGGSIKVQSVEGEGSVFTLSV